MPHNASENRLLLYGVYTAFIEAIKHYDGVQTVYRSLTSTILLGTFAGIGFLFSTHGIIFPFHIFIIVMSLCVLAVGAIAILCLLDLVFQERLLLANFIEALKMEKAHPWLPRIHHYMVGEHEHFSAPCRKVIFYIGCGSCLLILIGVFLHLCFLNDGLFLSWLLPVLVVFVTTLIYSFLLTRVTGGLDVFIKQLDNIK